MHSKRIFLTLLIAVFTFNTYSQNSLTDSLYSKAISYYGQYMERGTPQYIYTNSSLSNSCLSLLQDVIDNPGDSTLLDDALLLKAWLKADFYFPFQMDYPGCMSILNDLKNNFTTSTFDERTQHITVLVKLIGTDYEGPLGFLFQNAAEASSYLKGLVPYLASAYGLEQVEDEAVIQFKNYFQYYTDSPLTYKAMADYCPISRNLNMSTDQERISLYKEIIENQTNEPLRNNSLFDLYTFYGDQEKEYVRNYINQHSDNYFPFQSLIYFPLGNYTDIHMLSGDVSVAITSSCTTIQEMYVDSTISLYNGLLIPYGVHITKDNSVGSNADIMIDFNYPFYGGAYNFGCISVFNCSSDSLRLLLNHEFGHAIGLGHSYYSPALMNPGGNNTGMMEHIDSLAVTQLYSIPKITSATFSPTTITLPCTQTIEFQATVNDSDGDSDITGVWVDLSRFGGFHAESMTPQGNGVYTLNWEIPDSAFATEIYKYSPIPIIYTKDLRGNTNWKRMSDFKITKNLPSPAGPISGPATVCRNSDNLYSVPSIANADYYTWEYTGTGAMFSNSNNTHIMFAYDATPGILTVSGANACGNGTPSASFPISFYNLPGNLGTITGEDTVNQGQINVQYSIPLIENATSYVWTYWGTGVTLNNGTSNTITIDFGTDATSGLLSVVGTSPCGYNTPSSGCFISVHPSTYGISGSVSYNNSSSTALDSLWVYLHSNTDIIDSVTTNLSGQYSFPSEYNGTYILSLHSSKTWSGVNATDALKIQRHFAGLETITEPVRLQAADVNNSISVNGTDAVQVKRRFAGMDASFERGDWTFAKPIIGGDTIIVNGNNVTQDFNGLCVGDVNGSNNPLPGSSFNNKVTVSYKGVVEVCNNCEFDLPVRIAGDYNVNAISLVIPYPTAMLELIGVKTEFGTPTFTSNDGELRIAWSEMQSLNVNSNDTLIVLTLKAAEQFVGSINLVVTNESELADERGNVIPLAELIIPTIKPLNQTGLIDKNQILTHCAIFPNPANDIVNVEVKVSQKTKLDIDILDMLGRVKISKQIEELLPGMNSFQMNTVGLTGGVYTVKLQLNAEKEKSIYLYKLVIGK
jgi:hypothetical protein